MRNIIETVHKMFISYINDNTDSITRNKNQSLQSFGLFNMDENSLSALQGIP